MSCSYLPLNFIPWQVKEGIHKFHKFDMEMFSFRRLMNMERIFFVKNSLETIVSSGKICACKLDCFPFPNSVDCHDPLMRGPIWAPPPAETQCSAGRDSEWGVAVVSPTNPESRHGHPRYSSTTCGHKIWCSSFAAVSLVDLWHTPGVQEKIEESARVFFSNSILTVNLIPALLVGALLLFCE